MSWYNWLIVLIPFLFVVGMAFYAKRYIRDVVDFLSAGRVCGRYAICVAGLESGLCVMTLVAAAEVNFKSGFVYGYWGWLLMKFTLFLSLTGFFVYRFRETKAMTIGEFLERRYNRSFRIVATFLRTFSEMLSNVIIPAVTARFFIYLLDWPNKINICGMEVETFTLMILFSLIFALVVIWAGGQIALVITDTLQGIMSYPIFIVLTVFILIQFSWFREMVPALQNRVPNESFLNPFKISELRDFNFFAVFVTLFSSVVNRGAWCGGTDSTARSAHEGKMAGVLGTWRSGFSSIMLVVISGGLITFMSHSNYVEQSHQVRMNLAKKILTEQEETPVMQQKILKKLDQIPRSKIIPPQSDKKNQDTPYLQTVNSIFVAEKGDAQGNAATLEFRTLFNQMRVAAFLKYILPGPILALLCLLALMLMLSTDDSRIFSSARTLSQDIVMQFIKKPLTVRQQLWLIRYLTLFVCVVFFIGAKYLSQLDYLNLYATIAGSIWMGAAGSITLGGIYTRFGTTAGAYASLFSGLFISGGGILVQRNWPDHVYPFLKNMGWVEPLDKFLHLVSSPFTPYIRWEMNPIKFPVNSMELFFLAMVTSIIAYCAVSFLTCRKPYNLEKLLHRGKYNTEGKNEKREPWTFRNVFSKLIGITPEYTKGDRIIAWAVFIYSIVYGLLIANIGVIVWNLISPWSDNGWSNWFFATTIVLGCVIGLITSIWFTWGGIRDLRQLFIDLAKRKASPEDNGMVHKDSTEG